MLTMCSVIFISNTVMFEVAVLAFRDVLDPTRVVTTVEMQKRVACGWFGVILGIYDPLIMTECQVKES